MENPVQKYAPSEPNFSAQERQACKSSIEILLEKRAISECYPIINQFLSSYFLRRKPNGDYRFILNLKKLNAFLEAPHFKIEDLKTALKLITHNCFMSTIDMQDAYFLIPISKKHRKYLRFSFDGRLYEFNCMPFGLSIAPYIFTKLLKPVVQKLREQGTVCVVYLDDILIIEHNYLECQKKVKLTLDSLRNYGFLINETKSCPEPTHCCKFLGFCLDSTFFGIYLTQEKRDYIYKITNELISVSHTTIRRLAEVIGTLVSACPGVQYGWMYLKNLERGKFLALTYSFGNYEASVQISDIMKTDLLWWNKNIQSVRNSIKNNIFSREIFTDASSTGWGAFCNGEKARGWWTEHEKYKHINELELIAAFNGLKCFAKNSSDCEILMRIDNTTAMAYINKMGGVQYPHLNKVSRDIWQWCERKSIYLVASYINTKLNIEADSESRKLPPETEWALSQKAFRKITRLLGNPEIDIFASYSNAKCKRFISWKPDPESEAVDAFTLNWTNLNFYAFPPFSMILKVLKKLVLDKAEGIVVVPFWPTQPWFPRFQQLVDSQVLKLGPTPDLLNSPFRDRHPLAKKLILVAARLSWKHAQNKV